MHRPRLTCAVRTALLHLAHAQTVVRSIADGRELLDVRRARAWILATHDWFERNGRHQQRPSFTVSVRRGLEILSDGERTEVRTGAPASEVKRARSWISEVTTWWERAPMERRKFSRSMSQRGTRR